MTSYPCNKYEQITPSYLLSVKYRSIKTNNNWEKMENLMFVEKVFGPNQNNMENYRDL